MSARLAAGAAAFWLLVTAPAQASGAAILHYTARLHGVALLGASFCFQASPERYAITLSARTLGLLDVLVHGRSESSATGLISGGNVQPLAYADRSRLSGEDYVMDITYPGGHAVVRAQSPPQDKYRLPLPAGLLAQSVDGLSAVVVQSLAATQRQACASNTVYDGRQVRRLEMRQAGSERLAAHSQSAFTGEALRCETVSTMVGGFLKSQPLAEQSKPRRGTLWLAPVEPGGPALPVRMVFDADFWGDVVVEMDGVAAADACRSTDIK